MGTLLVAENIKEVNNRHILFQTKDNVADNLLRHNGSELITLKEDIDQREDMQ